MSELLNLTVEDGKFVLRNKHGEALPGVRYLKVTQDIDYAKADMAEVSLEIVVTTKKIEKHP